MTLLGLAVAFGLAGSGFAAAPAHLTRFQLPFSQTVWSPGPALVAEASQRVLTKAPPWARSSLESALEECAADLAGRLPPPSTKVSARSVQDFHMVRQAAFDALVALEGLDIPEARKTPLRERLAEIESAADTGVRDHGRAVVASLSERLASEARSIGRTLTLTLDDGSLLAVKKESFPEREAAMTARAQAFGLPTAMVLPMKGEAVIIGAEKMNALVYLVAADRAAGHFSYLGDRLSRPDEVRRAALASIDQLAMLDRHGHGHTSLAALSHSGTKWDWDYWRVSVDLVESARYGPTNIHNWESALAFPNLRQNGLADFEHVDTWERLDKNRGFILGQNLVEWSLATLRAARNNGFSHDGAAALLAEGLRHWRTLLKGEAAASDSIDAAVLETSHKFYRFAAINEALPRWMRSGVNGFIGAVSVRPIARGEGVALPGGVVEPLIARAIMPLVASESTRRRDLTRPEKGELTHAFWGRLAIAVIPAMMAVMIVGLTGLAFHLATGRHMTGEAYAAIGVAYALDAARTCWRFARQASALRRGEVWRRE
jgi:hypothetical protein